MKNREDKIIVLDNAVIGYKGKSSSVHIVKSGISVYALKGELVAVIGGMVWGKVRC
jgi:sulfur transfer complex TusBCD TusB component (DsrH family)